MALSIRHSDPARDGTLEVEEVHPNFVEVYFVAPERSLLAAGFDPKDAKKYKTKLLDINKSSTIGSAALGSIRFMDNKPQVSL